MKVAVVTTSRADYSIYFALLKRMQEDPFFEMSVIVTGMHLSKMYGETIAEIRKDGFTLLATDETIVYGDTPSGLVRSMGKTLDEMAKLLEINNFDLALVLGDRFEMFAATSAFIPYNIPVAHIHGGEETVGAIDNKFRHAMTKLSDFHFVSCERYRQRVIEMGADSKRCLLTGALALENIEQLPLYSEEEFLTKYGVNLKRPTLLVTYHPVTTKLNSVEYCADEFIAFLNSVEEQILITASNADTHSSIIRKKFEALAKFRPDKFFLFESLGAKGYFSAMKYATLMVGNTSSGIVEAASFHLPVVNVGPRQEGRERSQNTIDCEEKTESIFNAYKQAKSLKGKNFKNIYYQNNSSLKIVEAIKFFFGEKGHR